MLIFEKNKKPELESHWLQILDHHTISIATAPSLKRLHQWRQSGVTDVVTLLSKKELPAYLSEKCQELGIEWHHYPLSGKNLSTKADIVTLKRIFEFVEALRKNKQSRKIVIHCAAGMHRTGSFLFILLRHCGFDKTKALRCITTIRQITAQEMSIQTRNGVLLDKIEYLYQNQLE